MDDESQMEADGTTPVAAITLKEAMDSFTEGMALDKYFEITRKVKVSLTDLSDLCQMIQQPADHLILLACVAFRKMVSNPTEAPLQEIIDANMIQVFLGLLSRSDVPRIQFEVLWSLTNFASGKFVVTLIEQGAVEIFVSLLLGQNTSEVKEQTIWALGNISGDKNEYRKRVVEAGAIIPLCEYLASLTDISETNAIWCLANLVRGRVPSEEECLFIIQVIVQILKTVEDDNLLVDTMWTLSYISDGGQETIPDILELNCINHIVRGLFSENSAQIVPTLRTIGNFVTGTDEQTDYVLQSGFLETIRILMEHPEKEIRKEVMWTLSNICAGTKSHVAELIEGGIIDKLVEKVFKDTEDVQKEAVWALSNCCANSDPEIVFSIVESECIPAMCSWLNKEDVRTKIVILDGISKLLRVGESLNNKNFSDRVEECGGVDVIEELQESPNQNIQELAVTLMVTYFEQDEEDLGDNAQMEEPASLNFAM